MKKSIRKARLFGGVFTLFLISLLSYFFLSGKINLSLLKAASIKGQVTAVNKWDEQSKRNVVDLNWSKAAEEKTSYRLHQSNDGINWRVISAKYNKPIKVLLVYTDAHTKDMLKNRLTEQSVGLGLIQVASIDIASYNKQPNEYLKDDYQQDVLFFCGSGWKDDDLTTKAMEATKKFAGKGNGVLFGCTTVTGRNGDNSYHENFNRFAKNLGLELGVTSSNKKCSTMVVENGNMMKYPHEFPDSYRFESIPLQSYNEQFSKQSEGISWINCEPEEKNEQSINNSYLWTKNNMGWTQIGYDPEKDTKEEQQMLVNALVHLAQTTRETQAYDYTVKDDVAPELPTITVSNDSENLLDFEASTQDNGREYQWYVTTDEGSKAQKSKIVKEKVTSGIQGYIYVVDNSPVTVPSIERDAYGRVKNINADTKDDKAIIAGIEKKENDWLHVVAVDRANNVSATRHIQIVKKNKKRTTRAAANRTVSFTLERSNDTAKLVDISLGADLDKKMKSLEIKIPKNVVIKNYASLSLPSTWYKFQNSNDAQFQSFTFAMGDNNESSVIKSFLQSLEFTINSPTNQNGSIELVFHELIYTSWEDPNGTKHYYTFNPTVKTWLEAYNLAKKMRYKGLTGYLATLTSAEEHDFVYTNIAKKSGWLGGARLVRTNGAKLNDEQSISEKITDYKFTDQQQQWYWADGPEKGLIFFNRRTYNEGGKAPSGVYQGFNNPFQAGSSRTEPNNSGGSECILEFAQGSAGTPTKYWNDLSYNVGPVNSTGYYIEFSEYGSQKEGIEQTDVIAKSDIPQKVVVKAYDNKNNPLPSGDQTLDKNLRIGKKFAIYPLEMKWYDLFELRDATGKKIYPLEYTISGNYQEGKLIYNSRKLTMHIRQVVLNRNNQIVVPKNGYGALMSKDLLHQEKSKIPVTMASDNDNALDFKKYVIRYKEQEPLYTYTVNLPMYHQLMGYRVTTKQQPHYSAESTKTPISVNALDIPEFWLTIYIEPSVQTPMMYHWEYRKNELNKINILPRPN